MRSIYNFRDYNVQQDILKLLASQGNIGNDIWRGAKGLPDAAREQSAAKSTEDRYPLPKWVPAFPLN